MSPASIHPGTIVVGIDGSAPSQAALGWAAEQAGLEGRALTLVHAVTSAGLSYVDSYALDEEAALAAMSAAGRALLDQAVAVVEHQHPNVEVTTELAMADAREALLTHAEQAALVVMGTRGRGPVARLVLGSVSAAVTSHATCPVVVIRAHAARAGSGGILVGVDGHGTSSAAVELAYTQASTRRLPLTVMYCVPDPSSLSHAPSVKPYDSPGLERERLVLDKSVDGLGERFPDVTVTLVVGRGAADECLMSLAPSMDMVVVGTHHRRSLLGRLLNPDVERSVLLHASCIVAVVPELRRG